jgi:uncharacterized LabA/DUF88 family protein
LLDVIETEEPARRYDTIVVASGDGIFAEPVGRLCQEGCAITVVARRGSLSRRLRLAAPDVRFLDIEGFGLIDSRAA